MDTYSRLFVGGQRLSRFLFVRKAYSNLQNFKQKLNPPKIQDSEFTTTSIITLESSISQILEATRKNAVGFGINLEANITNQIYQFAVQNECIEPGYQYPFLIQDLDKRGQLSTGHVPLRALVQNPLNCSILKQICHDHTLLSLAKGYLNYFPSRISCHLTWSIATDLSIIEVEDRYPPATFHYDIAGYNFVTAYFYITPVLNLDSGPHEMIKGSHQKKPIWMLLKSGRHEVKSLYTHYNNTQTIQILGDKGFGFFQDPSCFHRVKPPTKQHRLLLQFRYA